MCWGVGKELQVVGLVLVMTGYVQRHHALEENFGGGVITEQSVSGDVEEFAFGRVRTTLMRCFWKDGSVET